MPSSEVVSNRRAGVGDALDAFEALPQRDVAEAVLRGAGDGAGRLRSRYPLDQGGQVADEPVVEPAVGVAF